MGGGQPNSDCKNSHKDGIRLEETNKKSSSRGGLEVYIFYLWCHKTDKMLYLVSQTQVSYSVDWT